MSVRESALEPEKRIDVGVSHVPNENKHASLSWKSKQTKSNELIARVEP